MPFPKETEKFMQSYFAVFLPVREGGYAVEFPDIPEAFTQGDTIEECVIMGSDVLNITVEEYAKARRQMPAPSSLEAIKAWVSAQKGDPSLAPDGEPFIQLFRAPDVDMTPVRVTVSFPKSTLEAIDNKAAQAGLTRSGFLAQAALAFNS